MKVYMVLDVETKDLMTWDKFSKLSNRAKIDWDYEFEMKHGRKPRGTYSEAPPYGSMSPPTSKAYTKPGPASTMINRLLPSIREHFAVFALSSETATIYVPEKKSRKKNP